MSWLGRRENATDLITLIKVIKIAANVTAQEQRRIQLEVERAAKEAEHNNVVATLAEALNHLSSGDLTASIKQNFPPSYERLCIDYNADGVRLG